MTDKQTQTTFFAPIACEKDCRFTTSGGSITCMYFPPSYDKHGNNTNPDRNKMSQSVRCTTCGKEWGMSKAVCDKEWTFTERKSHDAA